jgi:hypothetical protein
LRRAAQRERELARVDYLTGAVNPRFFYPMTANNGMVATIHCRQIPVFDQNGLWRYQAVLFSRHGNLRQTIISLITDSPKGLSAGEIAELVDLVPKSSFLSRFKEVAGVKREKHQGRFVYLSDRPEIYARQKRRWVSTCLPTDAQAVVILVQLIKHPNIDIEQLAGRVSEQGPSIEPAAVRSFLQRHDLLKNTSDTKP